MVDRDSSSSLVKLNVRREDASVTKRDAHAIVAVTRTVLAISMTIHRNKLAEILMCSTLV